MSRSATETFCSNLSQGIHAAAQPLAILRASLGNSYTNRMGVEELRELAANSAMEIERVCTFFSCLQQLVSTESIKPHLSEGMIQPLLAQSIDGVSLLFKEDGIDLRVVVEDICRPVFVNRTRMLQALASILLVAHAVSRPHDTVELIASSTASQTVQVMVRNVNAHVSAMNAEQSLSLALAEANIRSQQASLSWSLLPFSVQIELHGTPLVH